MTTYKSLVDLLALYPDPDASSNAEKHITPQDRLTIKQTLGTWAKITVQGPDHQTRDGWVQREQIAEAKDSYQQVELFKEPFAEEAELVSGTVERVLTLENWEKIRIQTGTGETLTGWIQNESQSGSAVEISEAKFLFLGKNEDYRAALLKAETTTGIGATVLAALVDAEAALMKASPHKGMWDPNSKNDASGAAGLTQFLKSTWLSHACKPGTLLNSICKQKGYLDSSNSVVPSKDNELLDLRFDPELSIVSAAEFGVMNLKELNEAGVLPEHLSDEDKARYIYLAHHEGAEGAIRFLRKENSSSRDKLIKQVGSEKAKALIAEAMGDVALAYRNWLNDYIQRKIRLERFRSASPLQSVTSTQGSPKASSQVSITTDTRYVTTEGLNLRAEPNGTILRELTIGDAVQVLGNAAEPKWVTVEAAGMRGVVFSDYLRQPIAPAKEALLKAAIAEWVRFQKGHASETTDPFCAYVGEMWQSIGLNYDGRSRYPDGREVPWSAAFISYVIRKAGPQYANFKFDASHSAFSHDAIQARVLGKTDKPFWGYRINERKPELGDLIHRNRGVGSASFDYAESHSAFESHSDIIVEVREKVVRVLGGNVGDTVSMRSFNGSDDLQEYNLDAAGFLASGQRIIALLKNCVDEFGA